MPPNTPGDGTGSINAHSHSPKAPAKFPPKDFVDQSPPAKAKPADIVEQQPEAKTAPADIGEQLEKSSLRLERLERSLKITGEPTGDHR